MTQSSVNEFLNRLETDAEFRNALINASNPAFKRAVIENAGYSFTAEELNEVLSDPKTSPAAKEHAMNAVRSMSTEDVEHGVLGWWLWPWSD